MLSVQKNILLNFSYRASQMLTVLLTLSLAMPCMEAVAADVLTSELNRLVRSKMTPAQRKAAYMATRLQKQIKANKKSNKAKPEPVIAATPVAPAANTASAQTYGIVEKQQDCYSEYNHNFSEMLRQGNKNKYSRSLILREQRELIALGFNPGKPDGWLGQNTKVGIAEYCLIDEAFPHWPQIMASVDFGKWVASESDPKEIERRRLSGNSGTVIGLLERYMRQKNFSPATWSDDFLISYNLNKDDFEQLRSMKDKLQKVEKLQTQTFSNRPDFETALETALMGVIAKDKYLQYAKSQTAFVLNEEAFNALKVENTPAYILQSIQKLQDLSYPEGKIAGAVDGVIIELANQTTGFAPEILKLAEISPSGALFTDNSLKKFSDAHKEDPLVVPILEKLKNMQAVEYQSDKTMSIALSNVLGQVVEQISSFQPIIVSAARRISVYRLSYNAIKEIDEQLKDLAVPEKYLALLEVIQGADYADKELFWLAMKSRIAIAGSNNIVRRKIFKVIDANVANKLDDAMLEKMKLEVAPDIVDSLNELKDKKFDNKEALENAVVDSFTQLSKKFDRFRPLIEAQAMKIHRFDKTKKIQWDGDSCNCVHRNLAGDIYGIYPFWQAGEKQFVDFSMLTRVGYYGLGFDDFGNIPNESRWSKLDTAFIREAQRYGSKVDLVIYRNAWKTWRLTSRKQKKDAYKALAKNIDRLLNIPLNDTFSELKPYLSLGLSAQPIMGDGVTLYFDGYPDDDRESVDTFGGFIRTLSKRLEKRGRKFALNIMFRSSEIGKGIHGYRELIKQIDIVNNEENTPSADGESSASAGILVGNHLKSRFIVLLEEPTTTTKKNLRLAIENGLHGKDRMKVLKSVVMTISYDGHTQAQLVDDVIYAGDNFGGLGFWPQVAISGVEATEEAPTLAINDALHENYINADGGALSICQYVCPHKWGFRIVWGIFFFTTLLVLVMRVVSCEWRSVFDKVFIPIVLGGIVPTFLLTMALLFCDPGWVEVSQDTGLPILVFLLITSYVIWNYMDKKRKANLP